MCLVELYCTIDDFWKSFKEQWNKHLIEPGRTKRGPEPELTVPEMMTIVILFHQSDYRTFKYFYFHICSHFKKEFPKLISYSRFVYLMKNIFVPLFTYLLHLRGAIIGIAFIDSTSIAVCHNKRIERNRVFRGLARGEILAFQLTPGNSF